jgi:pantetheine-phosphate adenylyltransferase
MPAAIIRSSISTDSVAGPMVQMILVRRIWRQSLAGGRAKEKIANVWCENYRRAQRARRIMPKIAVYPGTFDPITNGHLDVIRRAASMFDRVIVALARNPDKTVTMFSAQERITFVRQAVARLRNVSVDDFDGLLVRYARRKKVQVIVRGLRAVSDFEFEFQMALMNRNLDGGIETIFLMPKTEYTFISSHLVREIAMLGGDVSDFVPKAVQRALARKLAVKS